MNYPIYAAGRFIETADQLKVYNPYNNEHFAATYLANHDVIEQVISMALEVETEMANLPLYKKYEILMQIANFISSDADRLAEILSMESGKPMRCG